MIAKFKKEMEPTDFLDSDCRISDWHNLTPELKCRIWMCKCGFYWFQRHEWHKSDKNHTEKDEWIFTGYSTTKRFRDGLYPVEQGI